MECAVDGGSWLIPNRAALFFSLRCAVLLWSGPMSQLRSMYRTGQATMCTEQRLDFQLCLKVKAAAMKDPEGARVSADGQPASRSSHSHQSSALRAAILSIYPDAIAYPIAQPTAWSGTYERRADWHVAVV
jgi:hypothetical protein